EQAVQQPGCQRFLIWPAIGRSAGWRRISRGIDSQRRSRDRRVRRTGLTVVEDTVGLSPIGVPDLHPHRDQAVAVDGIIVRHSEQEAIAAAAVDSAVAM